MQQLATAGLRLVGLFDEFETVTGSDAFGAEFFGFLRSLANSYPVAYVTASRRDLRSLCRSQEISESPFFNIFAQVSLGPLEPEEAQRLICEPSAAAGVPLAEHAEELRALGGYLPLFLQMACSAAFECRLEDDGYDAGRVERRFREEADAHLTYLWEHLADDERHVMQTLMSGHEPAVEGQATLRRLETMGCVVREGTQVRPFTRSLAAVLAEGGVVEIGAVHLERVWEEMSEAQRLVLASVSAGKTVERRHQYAVESLRRLGLLRLDGEDPEFAAGLMRRHANQGGGPKKGLLRRLFG